MSAVPSASTSKYKSSNSDDSDTDQEKKKGKFSTVKKRTRCTKKVFNTQWLKESVFKNWLSSTEKDKYTCKCTCCNVILKAGRSELLKHSQSVKHTLNMRKLNTQQKKITDMVTTTEHAKRKQHEQNVKKAELLICGFFAEHNAAFLIVDHLTDMLKRAIPDSNILKDINLKRTKCTALIKNVLAKHETNMLQEDLQKVRFSILVDESTDISSKKLMCILVTFVSSTSGKVLTKLLELVHLDGRDCSAEALFTALKEVLKKNNLQLQNVLGVSSDGANVMVGKNNSFFSKIQAEVPHAILLKCICHSAALIASKACSVLPVELEELIRQTYAYVSGSSKRCAQLSEIQCYFNQKHQKILKLSGTRWLAVHQCVIRMLDNWETLKHYFVIAAFEDNLPSSTAILELLNNPKIKAYYLFLKYALDFMNQFNALFQSRHILINVLHKNSQKIFKQFAQNFIKTAAFKIDTPLVNVIHPYNYLPIENIFIGSECDTFIKEKLAVVEQTEIRLKLLDFYVTLGKEMANRLPLDSCLFAEFEFISPEHVFNKNRVRLVELPILCDKYKNLINTCEALNEWRVLPFAFDDEEINRLSNLPVDEMWKMISEYKDFTDKIKFSNIYQLAIIVLSLPHSNAEAERIFSIINDVKTKKRNRLSDEIVNSVCTIKSSFAASNINCTSFTPTTSHFSLFTSNIYN